MDKKQFQIEEALRQRGELNKKLVLIPYEGSIEIKCRDGNKYIYIRKKILGRYTSFYVGVYSDDDFASISKLLKEGKEYRKQIKKLDKKLALFGYSPTKLTPRVLLNIDFAMANMKVSIYDQAILEGVTTTFPDTETIVDNGTINGMRTSDVQKILNLKHAWEFILDKDVISSKTNYSILCHIAGLINNGFYTYGDRIRSVPVTTGGTACIPPLPIEAIVKETIDEIVNMDKEAIDIAVEICLYCMKTQIFIDGNKRTAIIFANHFLISKGGGLLVVPDKNASEFKKLLIDYYEGRNKQTIKNFMKERCWKSF